MSATAPPAAPSAAPQPVAALARPPAAHASAAAPVAAPKTTPTAAPNAASNAAPEWAARGERGSLPALRLMAWIALTLGRPLARLLLHPITLYFLGTSTGPRRQSARYLARALGRPPRWRERYRHVHSFAATVLDRLYFVRGRLAAFDIRRQGLELMDGCLAEGRGAFLLGAHVGSFEALHAVGKSRHGLRVAMAMYPDNARMIHSVLQSVAPAFPLGIITVGRSGSTLAMRDWLDGGGLVGLLGDRVLAAAGPQASAATRSATVMLPFLGRPAPFSDGPLRLALLLRRQVMFMAGLYLGGNRYEVRLLPLADFRAGVADPAQREPVLRAALQAYVAQLEALVREAPYNWFNFYDYWGEDACAGPP